MRIFGADRQRLFHHDVDAVAGAYLHHFSVVISVGVRQNGLRVGLLQHVFQVSKDQTVVEIELRRITRRNLCVRLGNSDNLDIGPVQRALEKAFDVAVNHARDGDPERAGFGGGLRAGRREDSE